MIAYSLPFIKFFISQGKDTISRQASGVEIRKTTVLLGRETPAIPRLPCDLVYEKREIEYESARNKE
ncbi:MAG TPA: hypothetical protein DCR97_10710 [Deltaproteobacteria bacterium]|nr:hypothetical protein [Deltaproteobacteria bacterium]